MGLAVAGDLGWRGIPCIMVEKSDGKGTQPKMDLLGVRTMEFCRRWGIVDWVENAGYQRDHQQDCAGSLHYPAATSLAANAFHFPATRSARRKVHNTASANRKIFSTR